MQKIFKKYFIFFLMGGFTLTVILINIIDKKKLDANGVYVIGKITQADLTSNGKLYKYEYYYDKVKYNGKCAKLAWGKEINDLFFLRTLPADLTIGTIEEEKVPVCLKLDSVPDKGWKELPLSKCR